MPDETETGLQGLLEAAPDAMVVVGRDGRILIANSQTEQLFGYTSAQLIGSPIELLVPPSVRPGHSRHREQFFADPQRRPMGIGLELSARRCDGSEFPVEISLSPVHGASGVRVLAAVRDISERRRLEEIRREVAERRAAEEALAKHAQELARSNADLEQFAYVASHDLQEPLRMIANYTQLLAKRYQGRLDPDADEFIGYVVGGVERMHQLITDLLTYSRVGTRSNALAPVNCAELVAQILSDLRVTIEQNGAVVTYEALPVITGDGVLLRQLFQNLLTNALKFHGARAPKVHLSAQRAGTDWLFAVRDNGIGIASEHAQRIFLIFQRLHTAAEYSGTGIGLAIAKKIVERHGGRIWVESKSGEGATFYFTIPAATAGTAVPLEAA